MNMANVKQRDGLTAWLILMIVANSAISLVYVLFRGRIESHLPNASARTTPTLAVIGVANVVCAVALFRWKNWGFWGLLGTSILTFVINLNIGTGVGGAIFGLLGIVILCGLLAGTRNGIGSNWSRQIQQVVVEISRFHHPPNYGETAISCRDLHPQPFSGEAPVFTRLYRSTNTHIRSRTPLGI